MKRILVLGNQGMLGHIVERYFKKMCPNYDVMGWNRNDFDARHIDFSKIVIQNFDYIINCVGILNTGTMEDKDLYADVNVAFPRMLAERCRWNGGKLIHVSTNCVFSDYGPHEPTDIPNATDIYGFSKALGEVDDGHNLTIRCSIMGTELKENGTGMINQYMTNPNFKKGFTKAMYNGVTTLELAKFIEKNLNRTGIVNFYTKKEDNKYNILMDINKLWNLNKPLEKAEGNIHIALLAGPDYTEKSFYEQLVELKDFNESYDNCGN